MENSDINVISLDSGHLEKYLLEQACTGQRFEQMWLDSKSKWCHWLSHLRQVVCRLHLNSHTIFDLSDKINDSLQTTNDCCLGLQNKFFCKVTTYEHHILYSSLTETIKREITNLKLTLQSYHCGIRNARESGPFI